jgi:hypothetical protein
MAMPSGLIEAIQTDDGFNGKVQRHTGSTTKRSSECSTRA